MPRINSNFLQSVLDSFNDHSGINETFFDDDGNFRMTTEDNDYIIDFKNEKVLEARSAGGRDLLNPEGERHISRAQGILNILNSYAESSWNVNITSYLDELLGNQIRQEGESYASKLQSISHTLLIALSRIRDAYYKDEARQPVLEFFIAVTGRTPTLEESARIEEILDVDFGDREHRVFTDKGGHKWTTAARQGESVSY